MSSPRKPRTPSARIPELAGLSGNALVQTFLFHQFSLLLLLVPIVSATALATHAVIGEKQSKALEPLLATPISTLELLAAKTLTPFLFALGADVGRGGALCDRRASRSASRACGASIVGPRLFIMFGVLGPLVELASLQVSVIVSSRASDPRSAQQLTAPADPAGHRRFRRAVDGPAHRRARARSCSHRSGCLILNAVLLWVGVRVFQARVDPHALALEHSLVGSRVQEVRTLQWFTWFAAFKALDGAKRSDSIVQLEPV